MGPPKAIRGRQINIFGIDRQSRDKFKRLCKNLGYPMNEVLLEIIEFVLEHPDNLKKFFQGRYDGRGKS